MRPDAPPAEAAAAGLVIESSLDVWYAGTAVAVGVPVGAGALASQVDQDVPERLDVSVPREWQGVILDPGRSRGVLGAAGHEVMLTVTATAPDGGRRWVMPRGRFLIHDWNRDGASIRLTGRGLLQRVVDRRRARPYAPGRASPIAGEVQSLLRLCGLESWVDPALSATRRVPADFVQGEDLWKSLTELLTAWPATARMDGQGVIRLSPALPADLPGPDVVWHDGQGGTVIGAPSEGTREGAYSHVIVKVKPEGDDEAEDVVERFAHAGPLAVDRFGAVSRVVESDAITTVAQAQAIAINELARAGLRARTIPVEMAPDWRVELDDVARVKTADGVAETGRVTGIELPLTHAGGSALVHVGVVT